MDQDPTFELLGLRRWVQAGLLDEFSAEPVVGAEARVATRSDR